MSSQDGRLVLLGIKMKISKTVNKLDCKKFFRPKFMKMKKLQSKRKTKGEFPLK